MKSLTKLYQNMINKVSTFNMGEWIIVKICMFSFTLMLAVLIPALVQVDWKIYGVISMTTYAYIIWRLFRKK